MQFEHRTEDASSNTVITALNSFLRGEISAVETYRQAYDRLRTRPFGEVIADCMRSHERRMNLLTQEISRRGGQPASDSGIWGTFAKAVEGSASAMGDKPAIFALEEGEDHGRNDYQRDMDKLDPETRQFVQRDLLAEQLRTHDAISALKKTLAAS